MSDKGRNHCRPGVIEMVAAAMTPRTREEHDDLARNEKVCGECDGAGRLRCGKGATRRCPPCLGRGRYSYTPDGNRVAYDAELHEWRST